MGTRFLLTVALLFLAACGRMGGTDSSASLDVSSARAFVELVYAPYSRDSATEMLAGDRIFSTELAALIEADRSAAQGEVGALDHDPLCACQDLRNFEIKIVDVARTDDGGVRVTVALSNDGKSSEVVLSLLREGERSEWRISDIEEPGVPSVAGLLRSARR